MTTPWSDDTTRTMRWDQHVDAAVEATGRGRYPRPEDDDLSWLDLADRDLVEGPWQGRVGAERAAGRLRWCCLIAVLALIPIAVVIYEAVIR